MTKHEVFQGWVSLREPDSVPERLRRPVVEYAANGINMGDEVTQETIEYFNKFNDLLAVALIESWSFSEPITPEGMLDLPKRTYDEIRVLVTPHLTPLMPNFEVSPDPLAPTDK